jgi:hypothetical protein
MSGCIACANELIPSGDRCPNRVGGIFLHEMPTRNRDTIPKAAGGARALSVGWSVPDRDAFVPIRQSPITNHGSSAPGAQGTAPYHNQLSAIFPGA